jgi:hypothetical protein
MKIKIGEIVILPFVVCMKIGVLFWGKNIDWGSLRTKS